MGKENISYLDHSETERQTSLKQAQIYRNLNVENIDPPSSTFLEEPKNFSSASREAYGFTNENLTAIMKELDFKDKKVACIGGSGDFGINAAMNGASSVAVIDISPVSCFLGELKIAGLSQFSYEEYLKFFATTGEKSFGPQSFGYSQYQELKPDISKEAQHFFDQLIKPEGNSAFLSPNGMLTNKVPKEMYHLKQMNPYLESEENYDKAKNALKNVEVLFYPQDIRDFLNQNKASEYGIIHLSNIFDYPPYTIDKIEQRPDEINLTIQSAKNALTTDGEVSIYEYLQKDNAESTFNKIQKTWESKGMTTKVINGEVVYHEDYKFLNLVFQRINPTEN